MKPPGDLSVGHAPEIVQADRDAFWLGQVSQACLQALPRLFSPGAIERIGPLFELARCDLPDPLDCPAISLASTNVVNSHIPHLQPQESTHVLRDNAARLYRLRGGECYLLGHVLPRNAAPLPPACERDDTIQNDRGQVLPHFGVTARSVRAFDQRIPVR